MNRVYRLVYSRVLMAWVAVSEITRGQGKAAKRSLVASALLLSIPLAQASPTGGIVTSGIGKISQSGNTTTITQGSQNLNLSWTGFNIGANQTVDFVQPNSSAVALNRIYSATGSTIMGHLNANGQVYLIDPNGIIFGKGAQVNVGGLVASAFDMTSTSANTVTFSGKGSGDITNLGTINAKSGGYIALLGHQVRNEGTVSARLGTVALAGGNGFTLTFNGGKLAGVIVTQSQLDDLASNGGILQANGGTIILTAGAKDALLASAVNNTGIVEAQTISNQSGHILLLSGMNAGTTNNNGTLDASAPNGGNGGFIETSGHAVNIGNHAIITTQATHGLNGSWLIDPVDFTIAASGGNETGAQLTTALGSGNVIIQSSTGTSGTAGNINVNDTVNWAANTLTLNAYNNININSVMNGSGTAKLALQYGQGSINGTIGGVAARYNVNAAVNLPAGSNFSTKLGTTGAAVNYTVDVSATDLQGMQGNLSGNYALGANIDATATSGWNGGAGFKPIGNNTTNFTGTLDGLGHTISNLTIKRPGVNYIGLFGYTSNTANIQNVGLVGGSVSGSNYVGGLVGFNYYGTLRNDYATGAVSGFYDVGGLVGANYYGALTNDYATGAVSGSYEVGGLVGFNYGALRNDYATGAVTGTSNVGGLVGANYYGALTNDYATGAVSGSSRVGGLVGANYHGTLRNDYATGVVSGGAYSYYVGGLVGINYGTLTNDYATGAVSGSYDVGGLVGINYGTLTNDYATGAVTGTSSVGGLVGYNSRSTLTNDYATGAVSGSNYVGGLVGYNHGTLTNDYATGAVSGTGNSVGGLVGINYGTLTNDFYDTTTTGSGHAGIGNGADSAGYVYGMTTAQMQILANFTSATSANGNVNPGWDVTTPVWGLASGQNNGMPVLCSLMACSTLVYVNPTSGGSTYGSTISPIGYALDNSRGIAMTLTNATVGGTATYTGLPTSTSNVGTYSYYYRSGLTLSGAGASNYVLQPYATASTWSIAPAVINLIGSDVIAETSYQQTFQQGIQQSGPSPQYPSFKSSNHLANTSALYQIVNGGVNVGQ